MKKRKMAAGLAVSLALTVGLGGCSGGNNMQEVVEEASVAVAANVPERGTMAVSSTFVGTVSPQEQVSIIPLVTGEVTEVNFEVGDYVEAGSVLVRIDDEAARLQLESARLTKQGAELSAQRTLGSAQVMSNLSMENSIKGIQFQIDQAKKQYNTASNSVTDAEEAKEDMKKALDKINSSISDMEDGYGGMKSMAIEAKKLVEPDGGGGWRWVDNLDKVVNWEEKYHTTPTPESSEGDGDGEDSGETSPTESNPSESNSSTNELPARQPSKEEPSEESKPPVEDSSEGESGTEESRTDDPEETPSGTDLPDESNSDTDNSDQDGDDPEDENGTASSQAEGPSESEGEMNTDSSDSAFVDRKNTSVHAVSYGMDEEDTFQLSLQEIRSHKKYNEKIPVSNLSYGKNGENTYKVISVTSSGDGGADSKKSYEQYLIDKGRYAAIQKLIASGYSPADIGEGRMDSSVSSYASQIASLKSQAATLESNLKTMDSNIESAETARSTTSDTINYYEENLKNAQVQYGIQTGQAYQDTAASLANQIASSDLGIASAQMQLENYVLTAPISGTIEQKNVDDFGMVSAGNPVYVISNKDSMTITFYVSEAVKNQLVPGQTITLERSGQTYQAAITQVGQSVDSRTSLFEVKAAVEGSNLASGVTVKILADTYKAADALLIPYDAVYFEGERAYVYCVDGERAVKTEVQTGLYNEDQIEIISGIGEESVVIRSWSPQLTDGAKVHVVTEEAEG